MPTPTSPSSTKPSATESSSPLEFTPVATWQQRRDADELRRLSPAERTALRDEEIEELRKTFKTSMRLLLGVLEVEHSRTDTNRTPGQARALQHAMAHCVTAIMTL